VVGDGGLVVVVVCFGDVVVVVERTVVVVHGALWMVVVVVQALAMAGPLTAKVSIRANRSLFIVFPSVVVGPVLPEVLRVRCGVGLSGRLSLHSGRSRCLALSAVGVTQRGNRGSSVAHPTATVTARCSMKFGIARPSVLKRPWIPVIDASCEVKVSARSENRRIGPNLPIAQFAHSSPPSTGAAPKTSRAN
jgi:hypothetical protein